MCRLLLLFLVLSQRVDNDPGVVINQFTAKCETPHHKMSRIYYALGCNNEEIFVKSSHHQHGINNGPVQGRS